MSSVATAEKENSKLTMADAAKKLEMENLGWSVNENEDKTWGAHERAGELRSISPARSISALHTQVMLTAGGNTHEVGKSKLEGGKYKKATSQKVLPGTENAIREDMDKAILSYRACVVEFQTAQKRMEEEKKLVMGLMHKFESELDVEADSGFKFRIVSGIKAILAIEEKEVLKTEQVKD